MKLGACRSHVTIIRHICANARQCGARPLTEARSFGPCWRPSLFLKPTPVYLQCRGTDAASIRDGRARAACRGDSFEQRHPDAGQHADRRAADDADSRVKSGQLSFCAFVKWHGLRLLEDELNELRLCQVPLRVITAYPDATDARALDALVDDFGARVRVNYETDRTRLHAKARNTGFHTAYVRSSNLSHAALVDRAGVEYRLSPSRQVHVNYLDSPVSGA